MNEQIMEYAEQARLHAISAHPDNHDIKLWVKVYHEKFAELIIQQCGVALSPMLRDMVSRGQAFDLIKKHFGVEK